MTAFDTDVLSLFLNATPSYVEKAFAIPVDELAISIVTYEETVRGCFNSIRAAQSHPGKSSLSFAYARLQTVVETLRPFRLLPFNPAADALADSLKRLKTKVGTRDLRIAATCIAANAKLVTRNRKDFQYIAGLNVEYW